MNHDDIARHFSRAVELPEAYAQACATHHRAAAERLLAQSQDFLKKLPLHTGMEVLDIGSGYGFHSRHFAAQGCVTTALTFHAPPELVASAAQDGYRLIAGDMHQLPFPDASFDLVWSHHSLEHSHCSPALLREWYRVARPGGWLAVTVPPHKNDIVSGHFHTGWNVGQLLYLTGVAGFDLRAGFFLEEGYNVRALVARPAQDIDPSGLSWLRVLKDRLPRSLLPHLREQPTSLGGYNFPGRLRYLDDQTCELLP